MAEDEKRDHTLPYPLGYEEKNLIESIDDINSFKIPSIFIQNGLLLLKISHKSRKRVKLKVEPSNFKFVYELPKGKSYEFLVDDIKGLFFGNLALNFREEFGISKEFEKQWLSVTFFNQSKKKLKTLHLIADTIYDFRRVKAIFVGFKTLKDDIAQNFLVNLNELNDSTKTMVIEKADCTENIKRSSLSLHDVVKFTRRMNINLSESIISRIFQESKKVATDSTKILTFDEFKNFVSKLNDRPDVTEIWQEANANRPTMSFENFKSFMVQLQQESHSEASLRKHFSKFDYNSKGFWSEQDLNSFLLSKFSFPVREFKEEEGPYCRPLNEYFILSSHNTYLLGRQIIGESSIEGYIKALQRGCRCLEIDIWNSGIDNDEPIVNHGRTFTQGILLKNVAKTIKDYAFQVTPYPLILSIENHCTPDFQRKAITIFRETFGKTLLTEPLNELMTLPSPEDLKNRILLKVKRTVAGSDRGCDSSFSTGTSTTTTTTLFSDGNDTANTNLKLKLRKKSSTRSVIKTLSDMALYVQGVKFRNFSLPESKTFNHCFSLSEKSIDRMIKDDNKKVAVLKHNRGYLMRIYPSKFRLKSTNFNPIMYWSHGVQMVATNWQTHDLGQQLNEAMFNTPFGDGYVLKPSSLRVAPLKGKKWHTQVVNSLRRKVSIRIISAHQLPKPIDWLGDIQPFLSLDIFGARSVNWFPSKPVTKIIPGNGFNPIWNETFVGEFEFDEIELVFLKLSVASASAPNNYADCKEVGFIMHKICDLKCGYRYLMLKDLSGEQLLYSSVLVKIDID